MKTKPLLWALICSCTLLSQCRSITFEEKEGPCVPLKKLAPKQSADLKPEAKKHYRILEKQIEVAQKWEHRNSSFAIAIYLQIAEYVWHSENPDLLPIYNHAVGQVLDLSISKGWTYPRQYETTHNTYQLDFDTTLTPLASVKHIDDIIPVDCTLRDGLHSETSQPGVGAAVVATHGKSGEKQNPFVPSLGGSFNLSAVIKFSNDGKALVKLYDPTVQHLVDFWGKQEPITINLSASTYVSLKTKSASGDASKLMGVFRPMKYSGRMGLHLEAPFDPNKTPLILVHGLVSSPDTWADPVNDLMSDPIIRKNFQAYMYYYPTGFPVRMTAAKLKEDLLALQQYTRMHSQPEHANNMVIIGHSMGGLLTSMMVRDISEDSWSDVSSTPIENLRTSEPIKEDLVTLFNRDQAQCLTRAVFIATPHRGSNKANTWYGSFIATLIKIPTELVNLDIAGATRTMTDLGKSVFNSESPLNSMRTLREGNPVLEYIAKRPIPDRIPYHSIMGDQGEPGDKQLSSDGVVPYTSSHLDGAESELLVPSGHGAHRDPAAVKELNRILHKHINKHNIQ